MIFKLSILAALVAPLVSALTVSPPTQAVTSGGSMTFKWQAQNGDPTTCSVFLSNPVFNSVFAIANNVNVADGSLTVTIPIVPENQQYTIRMVPIDNVNNVLAESSPFNIGPAASSVSGTTASAITLSSSASSATRSSTLTVSLSSASRAMPSSSSFGIVVSNTNTQPSSTATSPASSASTGAPTPLNSAALPVRFNTNMGLVASMILSVVAGAAVAVL